MTSPPQRIRVVGCGRVSTAIEVCLAKRPSAGSRRNDRRVGVNRSAPCRSAGCGLVQKPDRALAIIGGDLSWIFLGIVRLAQDGTERLRFIGAGGEHQGMARGFEDRWQKSDSPLM